MDKFLVQDFFHVYKLCSYDYIILNLIAIYVPRYYLYYIPDSKIQLLYSLTIDFKKIFVAFEIEQKDIEVICLCPTYK